MTAGRSKSRSLLTLTFIVKSISKKLFIDMETISRNVIKKKVILELRF